MCPGIATAAEAVRTATRVADALAHQVQLKEVRTGSGASVGVAWSSGSSRSGIDAETLVARADTARVRVEAARHGAAGPVHAGDGRRTRPGGLSYVPASRALMLRIPSTRAAAPSSSSTA